MNTRPVTYSEYTRLKLEREFVLCYLIDLIASTKEPFPYSPVNSQMTSYLRNSDYASLEHCMVFLWLIASCPRDQILSVEVKVMSEEEAA